MASSKSPGLELKSILTNFNKLLKPSAYSDTYDEFKSPPDFELAFNHGRARRVCKPPTAGLDTSMATIGNYSQPIKPLYCPCCALPLENE